MMAPNHMHRTGGSCSECELYKLVSRHEEEGARREKALILEMLIELTSALITGKEPPDHRAFAVGVVIGIRNAIKVGAHVKS